MTGTKIGNTTLGSLLFDKTTDDDNYAKEYWLASPGILKRYHDVDFGPGCVDESANKGGYLFHSDGEWYAYGKGVRPVVSLKCDVTKAQVKKLANQSITEDDWDDYSAMPFAFGYGDTGEAGNPGIWS